MSKAGTNSENDKLDCEYSVAYYYDDEGNPVRKDKATKVNIVIYDKNGHRINEVYGRFSNSGAGDVDKTDQIQYCRYYKGEKRNPYSGDAAMFWESEKWWLESFSDSEKELVLQDAVAHFIRLGMEHFEDKDGTPMTLKAILFNRYEHWIEGGPEDYREWYLTSYKKGNDYGKTGR